MIIETSKEYKGVLPKGGWYMVGRGVGNSRERPMTVDQVKRDLKGTGSKTTRLQCGSLQRRMGIDPWPE